MKIDRMIEIMEAEGVSLPKGTGREGRVMAVDLRNALGNHFFQKEYMGSDDPMVLARSQHMVIRRLMDPMKAYRYDKLKPEAQRFAMEHESWWAEEKYNGWRMVLTYIPAFGFACFGGNYSDVNFLPIDYTEKILFKVQGPNGPEYLDPWDTRFHHLMPYPCVVDSEVLCNEVVENRKGAFSSNTLDTVGTILSLPPSEAMALQIGGATLEFKAFDLVRVVEGRPERGVTYVARRMNLLHAATAKSWPEVVGIAPAQQVDKDSMLKVVWNRGGEGIILKAANGPYVPGGRLKDVALKVKRTMSGDIGDDLDAFVSGFVLTKEWSKENLIGGVELSVYMTQDGKEPYQHVIATVSSMPDAVREQLSQVDYVSGVSLKDEFYGKVLTIDGQELSARNKRLMHARADWNKGFRNDKDAEQCTMTVAEVETTMF